MQYLDEWKPGQSGTVLGFDGGERFVSRICSIGLTPGCRLTVLQNEKKQPILVYARNTMIAINREESRKIQVGGESDAG